MVPVIVLAIGSGAMPLRAMSVVEYEPPYDVLASTETTLYTPGTLPITAAMSITRIVVAAPSQKAGVFEPPPQVAGLRYVRIALLTEV